MGVSFLGGGGLAWVASQYWQRKKNALDESDDRRKEEEHARERIRATAEAERATAAAERERAGTLERHLEAERNKHAAEKAILESEREALGGELKSTRRASKVLATNTEAIVRRTVETALWATGYQAIETMRRASDAMAAGEAKIEDAWRAVAEDYGVEVEAAKSWLEKDAERPDEAIGDLLWIMRLESLLHAVAFPAMRGSWLAGFAIYALPRHSESYEQVIGGFSDLHKLDLDVTAGAAVAKELHDALKELAAATK